MVRRKHIETLAGATVFLLQKGRVMAVSWVMHFHLWGLPMGLAHCLYRFVWQHPNGFAWTSCSSWNIFPPRRTRCIISKLLLYWQPHWISWSSVQSLSFPVKKQYLFGYPLILSQTSARYKVGCISHWIHPIEYIPLTIPLNIPLVQYWLYIPVIFHGIQLYWMGTSQMASLHSRAPVCGWCSQSPWTPVVPAEPGGPCLTSAVNLRGFIWLDYIWESKEIWHNLIIWVVISISLSL